MSMCDLAQTLLCNSEFIRIRHQAYISKSPHLHKDQTLVVTVFLKGTLLKM